MGGFLVEPPDVDEYPSFPIDAEQLFHLIKEDIVEYPAITEDEIEDKSKSDGLSRSVSSQNGMDSTNIHRLITVAQALWFVVNCIFRWAQGIFVTTLELTTLAFILISLVTSLCWYHKPMDVGSAVTIKLRVPVDEIRSRKGAPEKWYQTPLDFLSRDECFLSVLWHYYTQILHNMRIPLFTRPTRRPYDYIPSHDFVNIDVLSEVVCAPTIILFSCLFIVAWNSEFPSPTEHLLWRIASISMLVFGLIGGLFSVYLHHVVFGKERKQAREKGLPTASIQQEIPKQGFLHQIASRLRNIDPEGDPQLDVPIRVLIPLSSLCAMYVVARLYILVEDFIGLRHLPKSAFQTVEWADYVPYL
ncbi:hypothetical protein N7468_008930 [Penicillium chermesinum]|uniref:Uncharacterized protein n=1 Tax=Penicillium chermesinum TaxID=63820 RepID=A0A9W9TEJ0_9EURO|nr:uncharacterized protein N7468_008930 [Penicillium chermesinum]KAJ5219726.1 hypothetical protein N7468_008930 [Penicillium chermesinum]